MTFDGKLEIYEAYGALFYSSILASACKAPAKTSLIQKIKEYLDILQDFHTIV